MGRRVMGVPRVMAVRRTMGPPVMAVRRVGRLPGGWMAGPPLVGRSLPPRAVDCRKHPGLSPRSYRPRHRRNQSRRSPALCRRSGAASKAAQPSGSRPGPVLCVHLGRVRTVLLQDPRRSGALRRLLPWLPEAVPAASARSPRWVAAASCATSCWRARAPMADGHLVSPLALLPDRRRHLQG